MTVEPLRGRLMYRYVVHGDYVNRAGVARGRWKRHVVAPSDRVAFESVTLSEQRSLVGGQWSARVTYHSRVPLQ